MHKPMGKQYADDPIKLRIHHDGYCWNLDGIDADGLYTEECFTAHKWSEIVGFIPRAMKRFRKEEGHIELDSLVMFLILLTAIGAFLYLVWHVLKAGAFWT